MKKLNKLFKTILFIFLLLIWVFIVYKLSNFITNKILDNKYRKNKVDEKISIDGKHIIFKTVDINENIKIRMPDDFNIMPEEKVKIKYPSGNTPSLVYSNDEYNVNVAFSLSNTNMSNDQISSYHEYIKVMIKNSSEILSENVYKEDGRMFGKIKFITSASDTDIYNHMKYFSLDNKLIIVNFNCTVSQRDSWEKVGNKIISSLIVEK